MNKVLVIEGYTATAEVKKVKCGYAVVIIVSFSTNKVAQECLKKILAKMG